MSSSAEIWNSVLECMEISGDNIKHAKADPCARMAQVGDVCGRKAEDGDFSFPLGFLKLLRGRSAPCSALSTQPPSSGQLPVPTRCMQAGLGAGWQGWGSMPALLQDVPVRGPRAAWGTAPRGPRGSFCMRGNPSWHSETAVTDLKEPSPLSRRSLSPPQASAREPWAEALAAMGTPDPQSRLTARSLAMQHTPAQQVTGCVWICPFASTSHVCSLSVAVTVTNTQTGPLSLSVPVSPCPGLSAGAWEMAKGRGAGALLL